MMVDVLLGLQWGDEGKGKIVDYLAPQYGVVARFQGGPNAGHTLVLGGQKYVLHTIPSGIFREGIANLIGNGVVIDPVTLRREIEGLTQAGIPVKSRLYIARKAHLILPGHRLLDAGMEAAKGHNKIGSTLRGIGPTYTDKIARQGLRIGDIFAPDFEQRYRQLSAQHQKQAAQYPDTNFPWQEEEDKWLAAIAFLRDFQFVNGEYFIDQALKSGQRVLAEGAQGAMLDVDFGTYPFVTSSNTTTSGVCSGLGLAPQRIGEVIGITKAYCTRVGSGPFPTELLDETGEALRRAGHEFGATTGRPRRCGWLDIPQLRYTIMLNGVTQLVMTKADVLAEFAEIKVARAYRDEQGQESLEMPYDLNLFCPQPIWQSFAGWSENLEAISSYEALPASFRHYTESLEQALEVPFKLISVGPAREALIVR